MTLSHVYSYLSLPPSHLVHNKVRSLNNKIICQFLEWMGLCTTVLMTMSGII